jgi:hypothetical protein
MTTDPTTALRPTNGQPEFIPRYDYEAIGDEPASYDPESVGWDLSFGSRISFGPEEDGALAVHLNLSDDAIANTYVHRAVTPEQIVAFAQHLLDLVGARPVWTLPAEPVDGEF